MRSARDEQRRQKAADRGAPRRAPTVGVRGRGQGREKQGRSRGEGEATGKQEIVEAAALAETPEHEIGGEKRNQGPRCLKEDVKGRRVVREVCGRDETKDEDGRRSKHGGGDGHRTQT